MSQAKSLVCRGCSSFVQQWTSTDPRMQELAAIETSHIKGLFSDEFEEEALADDGCCAVPDLRALPDPDNDQPYEWPCPRCLSPLTVDLIGHWD